jgi:transposase-like protein
MSAASRADASQILRDVRSRLEAPAPKVARLLEAAEDELLAFMSFPRDHWPKLRSTNPLERLNREIARLSDVVGIYPNDAALIPLVTMLLIEQCDEWLVGRRYLSQESLATCFAACAATLTDSD